MSIGMYEIGHFLAGIARQLGFRRRHPIVVPYRVPVSGR